MAVVGGVQVVAVERSCALADRVQLHMRYYLCVCCVWCMLMMVVVG